MNANQWFSIELSRISRLIVGLAGVVIATWAFLPSIQHPGLTPEQDHSPALTANLAGFAVDARRAEPSQISAEVEMAASDTVANSYQIEKIPISHLRVGMRVPAHNPELSVEDRGKFLEPDAKTWQALSLELEKPGGEILNVEMIRPIQWIHDHQIHQGGTFYLDLPEMGAKGDALVTELRACPPIAAGAGEVVLTTFAHPATEQILDVSIGQGDEQETVGVTANHPFWNPAKKAFIEIGEFEIGDTVLTRDGQLKRITSILPRPGPSAQVFNLEVNGEHVYYVGADSLLVHNSYSTNEPGISILPHNGGIKNPQRGLFVRTEAHHPFFRMFLRAMKESELFPQILTASGRIRPQNLAYMDIADHRLLHADWNRFIGKKKLNNLQTVAGNGMKLQDDLVNGNITPIEIFENLEKFYGAHKLTTGDIWLSLFSFKQRLGF